MIVMSYVCSSCGHSQRLEFEKRPWHWIRDQCDHCATTTAWFPDLPVYDPKVAFSMEEPLYLYLMCAANLTKIGISKNPRHRLQALRSGPLDVELIWYARIASANVERALHRHFAHKRVRGEWFELAEVDVKYIKQIERG